jgi:hypothetical protein
VRAVSEWGLRVEPQVYEAVKQDKLQDGIVNRKTVGFKKRGIPHSGIYGCHHRWCDHRMVGAAMT